MFRDTLPQVPAALTLDHGPLRLQLLPELGGSVGGLWHGDVPVLRHTETPAGPRQAAGFPMVPYSNRLGYRRFRWRSIEYTTQPNFEENPHSLHGVAWQRPWAVVERTERTATLAYHHEPDEHWPFAFEVRQRFGLEAGALQLNLSVSNRDARVQPLGLGWHPYFVKRDGSTLDASVSERWESDASTQLPTHKLAQPRIDGEVAGMDLDHCFEGWQGAAHLRDPQLTLRLSSSLTRLVVYTPRDKLFYCVEPVSHVNNAIQMDDPQACGLVAAEPGQVISAWIRLEVARI
jgi:aldose 1-epimerase